MIDDHAQTTSFTYDANGNLATVLDALGELTTFTYDERDLPLSVIDSQAPAGTTEYRFDPNGKLASIRSPEGHLTSYSYDDFDRTSRMTHAYSSYEEYGYDEASNLTSLLTANGQTIAYVHDELDQLTSIARPGGTDSYDYDAGGRMTLASNAEAAVSFLYDAADRVTHEIATFAGSSQSHVIERRFDAADRIDRITYPDASQIFLGYDPLGRLDTVSATALLATYGYDALGNPTSIERANGVDTSHVFDSLERLVELDHDAPLGSLDARTFAYDGLDRRTDEVGPEGAHEFDYDSLSQLVATVRPGGYPFDSTTFTLDADGNRTAAGGTTYVPNSLDQYASVGGTSYTYDSAGNLTDDGTFAYGYDAENRLTSVSGTALIAAYGYDALGRRIRKTVNGTTTLYVHGGDQILEELNAAEVVQATFVYGLGLDEPLTMQRSSQTSWYLRDPIGTVTALTDALGAVAESYRYDAFGELAMFDASGSPIAASALQNPFLFAGRELDGETGVYHYRARAYSPVLGRFLQRDPLGQLPDVNVYRYVGNHPLDMIDPYGLFEERTHWTEWIPFDDYIFSPGVANFSAGMGDGISRRMLFGYNLTGNIRNAIGAKGVVNECSGAYFAGDLAAEAWERITFRGRGKGGPDVSLGARSRRAAPRGPGGPHTPDQRALKDLVEDVTNKGTKPLSREDAETVLDWAREVGYPGVRASAGDLASPSNWTANPVPHIHLPGTGRHGHVPVLPGVRPR